MGVDEGILLIGRVGCSAKRTGRWPTGWRVRRGRRCASGEARRGIAVRACGEIVAMTANFLPGASYRGRQPMPAVSNLIGTPRPSAG